MSPSVTDSSSAARPLPDSKSPSLALVHPTSEEKQSILRQNGASWRGPLSLPSYLQREEILYNEALTRDGGITHWVLVDTAEPGDARRILASCESIRKQSFVAIASDQGKGRQVDKVLSHGVGSVFCDPHFRGRGYAGRMMKELGNALRTWQIEENTEGRQRCLFSVLYSDIGKKFYASYGWHPFPSSHIALPVPDGQTTPNPPVPSSRAIYARDLPELCRADQDLLRRDLASHISDRRILVAIIPDAETMRWHHAREDFVGRCILNKSPEVKGAIIGNKVGSRAWCIWTRVWSDDINSKDSDNKLFILRLVVEGDNAAARVIETGANATVSREVDANDKRQREMITSLLLAAQAEAAQWALKEVHMWNPTRMALLATQQAWNLSFPHSSTKAAEVVDRDIDSITSLMWYGNKNEEIDPHKRSDVEWIGNEKYAWC
ncbi:MAG: hypothetical protein M1837_007403 [Sclerophora amabilis]|nr:MAG: hypothetical protein M1837_007403 [Sclerophora amabilis]